MKMSLKLIILFSALAVAITVVFSFITYRSNLQNLYNNTYTSLNAMGKMMQTEIEDYFTLMDYSVRELASNPEFMDAFEMVSNYQDSSDAAIFQEAQATMTRVMLEEPLQVAFYRVSAYTKNGFYLTSPLFEGADTVSGFSKEARETIASLDYLEYLSLSPDNWVILGPHQDPWTTGAGAPVFSYVKGLIHHGSFVGYLEISASLTDLAQIFLVMEQEGISTQADFDDGASLFRMMGNDIDYQDLPIGEMTTYHLEGTSDRWVVRQYSESLGLNIYVSQEIDALGSTRTAILLRSVIIMIPILAVALLLIIIFSYKLTGSIRKLNRKIKSLPAKSFLSQPDTIGPYNVVSPSDKEMYELEESFNDMLTKLRSSHANEVTLREGTLRARLNALQMQINPHFVYNTLNIISAKGLESGNEEITVLCDQFAQMLRYSTDVRSQTATLKDELENVRQYLALCKSRYEDQLEYEIDVSQDLMNILVPKLTLQPLVENAMKYGRHSAETICQIWISGTVNENRLSLTIRDNGDGFDWETLNLIRKEFRMIEKNEPTEEPVLQEHLGLINTYRRLFYYSHGTIHMDIYNQNGAVVELTQKLPDTDTDTDIDIATNPDTEKR